MTEKKLKYISDEIKPLTNSIEYNYDVETNITRPKCKNFNFNNIDYSCDRKKQQFDTAKYIPIPYSVSTGDGSIEPSFSRACLYKTGCTGYNNLENYSLLKFGESSRLNTNTLRDIDNDRIYLTLNNYHQEKKYTLPEDTRHLNKKYYI
jgi:hypothetical protein